MELLLFTFYLFQSLDLLFSHSSTMPISFELILLLQSDNKLSLHVVLLQLISYFSSRSITAETLRRNGVMQKPCGSQVGENYALQTYFD